MRERTGLFTHLIRTSNDPRKIFLHFLLAFHHCFNDRRVVATQIDKDMGYTGLEDGQASISRWLRMRA